MELNKSLTFHIDNNSFEFRTINEFDVTQAYIDGLKKQKYYIENIPDNLSVSAQKIYVKEIIGNKSDTICGLFLNRELIATAGIQLSLSRIFLQNIEIPIDNVATIGIFIFKNSYRGMGLGKTLVWASTKLFHVCTQTEWFGAGMEIENAPSLKSFLVCGYEQVYQNAKYYQVLLNIKNLKKPKSINIFSIKKNEIKSQ